MVVLTFTNFFTYFFIAWSANISLNLLYVVKRYAPDFKHLNYPLDFKTNFRGERLIGDSVNIIGLIFCLAISLAVYSATATIIWASIPVIVYVGNLLGSFIKRRMHLKSGEFLPIIDHGDYMLLLGIVFTSLHYIEPLFAILAILLTYILHPIACLVAFKFKLRENPY
ncbi:MAG: CDP-archaeol synthase [Patescibacteria group bacterium]|jgi:CDP-2,3-bis-(O-geranylgeranyl)-sn-glycerol synthase